MIASAVYHLATRDELLPRFSAEQMPRRPGGQREQQPPPPTPPATTRAAGR